MKLSLGEALVVGLAVVAGGCATNGLEQNRESQVPPVAGDSYGQSPDNGEPPFSAQWSGYAHRALDVCEGLVGTKGRIIVSDDAVNIADATRACEIVDRPNGGLFVLTEEVDSTGVKVDIGIDFTDPVTVVRTDSGLKVVLTLDRLVDDGDGCNVTKKVYRQDGQISESRQSVGCMNANFKGVGALRRHLGRLLRAIGGGMSL